MLCNYLTNCHQTFKGHQFTKTSNFLTRLCSKTYAENDMYTYLVNLFLDIGMRVSEKGTGFSYNFSIYCFE